MGSCFSSMIGRKLEERKFKVLNNPFGTIFNPVSLLELLHRSLLLQPVEESLLVAHDQWYYHYSTHSDLSASEKDRLITIISERQSLTHQALRSASHIFLTLGTAYAYELISGSQIVANCHRQPKEQFKKRLLDLDEMMVGFKGFYNALKLLNPTAELIVTVSPVRHIKDGIPENQLSKSLLRVLCDRMTEECPRVSYFPSYELMMDDLRDYRYYKDDMIHPTAFAENYIWELFKTTYLSKEAFEAVKKTDAILNDLQHKPFHPESASHQQFLQKLLHKMEQMDPIFDFSKEISVVTQQLNSHRKEADHESKSQ